jgi:glycosyltransferase involved in cell wall biosynthesis
MKVINPGRTIGAMYERAEAREKICDFCPSLLPYRNNPWVICLAELHPIKRHTVLFSAFAEVIKTHPSARLICIGDGRLREALATDIVQKNLSEQVFLLGPVTEAARFLKAFDLLTLASKSESYGYVLHEAGLAGVPVVATNVGGIPDIVTGGKTGLLVPPEDSAALAAALTQLLTDARARERYAHALQEYLTPRTIKDMAKKVETLYLH